MTKKAVVWIRDGVIVNRMHLNAVAFAICAAAHSKKTESLSLRLRLADLISFAFEKSGNSCLDKLVLYNRERGHFVEDETLAVASYNSLTSRMPTDFFQGMETLLTELHANGIENFISSAVEQSELDSWAESEQGKRIAPYITELLGRRKNFSKGRDHFQHIYEVHGCKEVCFVADADMEIQSGRALKGEFNLTNIGFCNIISQESIDQAFVCLKALVAESPSDRFAVIEEVDLLPPIAGLRDAEQLKQALKAAGADYLVTAKSHELSNTLRQTFTSLNLLK